MTAVCRAFRDKTFLAWLLVFVDIVVNTAFELATVDSL